MAQQRITPTQVVFVAIAVLILWGIPVIMTTLSSRMPLARRWAPSWRAGVPFLVMVVIGAAIAGLECVVYQLHFLDYQVTYTLMYGAGVTFAGYLLALLGALLLLSSPAPISPAAPRVAIGARRARWLAGGALLLSLVEPTVGHYLVVWIAEPTLKSLAALDLGYPWLGWWLLLSFQGGWLLALLFVGAPMALAILGTATLSARSWIPGRRAVILGAVLIALGAGSASIAIVLYTFPHLIVGLGLNSSTPPGSGVPGPIAAIEVIPMLLGYLLALLGVIWLPRIAPRSTGASSSS